MKISNWDTWQTFRKDRGTPPWIKVYRNLLSNEQWVELSDSEKGQLVSIWILAADKDGTIPDSPKMIQRMAMLDSTPNINKFIGLGFLSTTCQPHDNQEINPCPHVDAPEKRREETEERREDKALSPVVDDTPDKIFNYWCEVMDKGRSAFSPKRKKLISDRLKDGYSEDEIKLAIFNCSNTPHNMGVNTNNKKYNNIELICRDTEKLEQFRDNAGVKNGQYQQPNQQYICNNEQQLRQAADHSAKLQQEIADIEAQQAQGEHYDQSMGFIER